MKSISESALIMKPDIKTVLELVLAYFEDYGPESKRQATHKRELETIVEQALAEITNESKL